MESSYGERRSLEQLGGEEELGELEHMLKCRELSDRLWCGKKKCQGLKERQWQCWPLE